MKPLIYILLIINVFISFQHDAQSQIYSGGKDDGFAMFQFAANPNQINGANRYDYVEIEFKPDKMVITNRHYSETAAITVYSLLGQVLFVYYIPSGNRETIYCEKEKFMIIKTSCGPEIRYFKISLY